MGPAVGAVYKAQANEELDNGFRSRMGGDTYLVGLRPSR